MNTRISHKILLRFTRTSIDSSKLRISATTCVILVLAGAICLVSGCKQVYFGPQAENNIACQCDAKYCDSLAFEWPKDASKFVRVTSTKAGARLQMDSVDSSRSVDSDRPVDFVVDVQTNFRLQQLVGYGGAVSDAAAINILDLPEDVQRRVFEDYFGPNGLDYNMARVPCGGTDMSTRAYSYDDLPAGQEDLELRHFKLQPEDLDYRIPFIKRANEMRTSRGLEELKLLTTSWSPPTWMKDNGRVDQGYLKGDHLGAYYWAYAKYYLRFLEEYERHNVTFWGLAAQNEPYTVRRVGISFNSLNFQPNQLANFNEFNLIPALKSQNRTQDKLILFLFDDNLNGHEPFTEALLSRPNISDFARGLARHWYIKDDLPYVELSIARLQYPFDYIAASTEASFIGRPKPGNWQRAELYALDIIENLSAGFGAWLDWNLALDMGGGPSWMGNYLDAAILVDSDRQVYYKNPMYYALAHFTRFLRPNSRVVSTQVYPRNETSGASNWTKNFDRSRLQVNVIAGELSDDSAGVGSSGQVERRFAVVALNRAPVKQRIELRLSQCLMKLQQPPLVLDLESNSITSFAFNC